MKDVNELRRKMCERFEFCGSFCPLYTKTPNAECFSEKTSIETKEKILNYWIEKTKGINK